MSRWLKGWMSFGLALGIGVAGLPAQASEVVKLARLVVSGKRSTADAPRTIPSESRSRAALPSHQTHGNNGGGASDEAGTAPAPARGVS